MEAKMLTSHAPETLRNRGIFNFETFKVEIATQRSWLVEGLFDESSVNILVGDSGLGKTPFGISLGISVAAGIEFLGRRVAEGSVLYCDAESRKAKFHEMVGVISANLGLASPPPDFLFWSPFWDATKTDLPASFRLLEHVRFTKPKLVLVDPLRPFWPMAAEKPEASVEMIAQMRKTNAAWLITHHRRKQSRDGFQPSLSQDPHSWFQEAAGSHSLINHTDTRLGIEPSSEPNADLVVGGFVRSEGSIPAIHLAREHDDAGRPVGYQIAAGAGFLNPKDQVAWAALPAQFRYTDVKNALGGSSDSNAKRFLDQCIALDILRHEAAGGRYVKRLPGRGVGGESVLVN
jgi:hypothetical protein